MTLKEKIGQLLIAGFEGTTPPKGLLSLIKSYQLGGVILFKRNLVSPPQIAKLCDSLQKASPHVPLFISIDHEGGRVNRLPKPFTVLPSQAVIGACNSSELSYAIGEIMANELKTVGINFNFAPVLDVHTNPAKQVIGDRAFGKSAGLVSTMGLAIIASLQDNGVLACAKHFPGHGDTATDSHEELPVVNRTLDQLREVELRPFQHAMMNGLRALMTAHVKYPALDETYPATLSRKIITKLLRSSMRFDGLVLTDDLEMKAITQEYGLEDAAIKALLAGADLLLVCHREDQQVAILEAILKAVKKGLLSEKQLDTSLLRILSFKQRYMSLPKPVDLKQIKEVVGCSRHRQKVQEILVKADQTVGETAVQA
jgi:beta-N-acetylhexosaminidase